MQLQLQIGTKLTRIKAKAIKGEEYRTIRRRLRKDICLQRQATQDLNPFESSGLALDLIRLEI